ncbi:MAG: glycosyltransferase family 2 protein [Planctomycetota bacterium]
MKMMLPAPALASIDLGSLFASPLNWLMGFAVGVCALTLTMTVINLRLYQRPGARSAKGDASLGKISVCVPARNEQENLRACVRSILDNVSRDPSSSPSEVEVLVYDDGSTDDTPRILRELVEQDARVIAAETQTLPDGWNGKQHGCDRMGRQATGDWLLFTDADVRFEPGWGDALLAAHRDRPDAALLSTFPRQIVRSLAERMAVPMIFFILFSYLPMARMRTTRDPGSSAGCGQFLFVKRDAYLDAGGHAAFKDTMHDGIKMPRALRGKGYHTDLFDGTTLCRVRMYRGLAQTWRGFAKNAFEGLGSVGLLVFITLLHLLGHALPWAIVAWLAIAGRAGEPAFTLALAAVLMAAIQRLMLARRFRHGPEQAALHPLSVLMMTAIQWHSLVLAKTGRRSWRGRTASQPA